MKNDGSDLIKDLQRDFIVHAPKKFSIKEV